MKKIIPAILAAIWLVFVAYLAYTDGILLSRQEVTGLCQEGIQTDNGFYIVDNREKESVIYLIDEYYQVSDLFLGSSYSKDISIKKLAFSDVLYVLLEEAEGYRIISLDDFMEPMEISRKISKEEMGEGEITSFSADETGFYLTFVPLGGQEALTYFADREEAFTTYSEEEEYDFLWMENMTEAPYGRRIVEADYLDGEYLLRLDNGVGKEYFLLEEEITDAYYGRQLTLLQTLLLQKDTLFHYLLLMVAGCAVILFGSRLLKNRNYMIYTIVIVEIVLFSITFLGGKFGTLLAEEMMVTANKQFGAFYLEELKRQIGPNYKAYIEEEDFHNSEGYFELSGILEGFMETEGISELFQSVSVVRLEDNLVLADTRGRNMEQAAYQYSTDVIPMLYEIKDGQEQAAKQVVVNGKKYLAVAVSDKDSLNAEYCYLGLLKSEAFSGSGTSSTGYWVQVLKIFLVGSVICVIILLIRERDFTRLKKAMADIANGDYQFKKAPAHGKDMKAMWNSLLELEKRISRINYERFHLYESCYRFAPKNIEKILKRDSITNVKSGDATELYGTLAMMNTRKHFHMDAVDMYKVNKYIELMEKHKGNREAFFLSGNNNLKNMKMLFLQECGDTIRFGIDFMKEVQQFPSYDQFKVSILLHYNHYVYGVAGSDNRCFSFLFYQKMEKLERLGQWLQQQQIKLAVTENVRNREGIRQGIRYIGYVLLEEEQKVKLYEILDACNEEERKKKLSLDSKFQRALELFYQYDFYLARSTFSEVIKENPEDQIAKWYLFTCQKYLNQSYSGEVSFELWEKEE